MEFNPNRIWICVYFTDRNELDKCTPMLMSVDVNTSLLTFIKSCYEKLTRYLYNPINSMPYE